MASAILAAGFVRGAMGRAFYGTWDWMLFGRLGLFAVIVAVVWFVFTFVPSRLSASAKSDSPGLRIPGGVWSSIGILATIASIAIVLAIAAWLALAANDELLASRLEPWVSPLIWLQRPGFQVVSRLFRCPEGLDNGCAAYKTLPTFLLSNAAAYFPFVLAGWCVYRRSEWTLSSQMILRTLIRWGTGFASLGLCLWLFFVRLMPDLYSPLRKWDIERLGWTALESATGILSLLLFFAIPLSVFRALRASWAKQSVRAALVDLTWLTSFAFVALILGNK